MRIPVAGSVSPVTDKFQGSEEKRRFYCERGVSTRTYQKGRLSRCDVRRLRPAQAYRTRDRCALPPRRDDKTKDESCDESAQMRGHADLWRRQVEGDLDHYDHYDVSQSLFRLRRMAMSH